MKIALLGKVPKGDGARKDFAEWHREYFETISAHVPDAEFLHGDVIRDNEGPEMVVGHNLWLVKHADVAVVDARTKIGAGTAQEMVMAKYFKKPLASVIPKDTHHRRSNVVFDGVTVEDWVHPFLEVSSDYVADSIKDAAQWLAKFSKGEVGQNIKGISTFESAIAAFEFGLPEVVKRYKERGW